MQRGAGGIPEAQDTRKPERPSLAKQAKAE